MKCANVSTIMVTGASGFIGQKICRSLSPYSKIIAFDKADPAIENVDNLIFIEGDITSKTDVKFVCKKYHPDIIIHCAGIAHQKINSSLTADEYDHINHIATQKMSLCAVQENPDVHFFYLSSISVYGENHKSLKIEENSPCLPTTPYALSKLNGEKSLIAMFHGKKLKKLDILRLAPVYDKEWSLNIEKRVFGPKKMCYLKFGSGKQKMSILARSNLIDFIKFRLQQMNDGRFCNIFNVCDKKVYSFNQIIDIFKRSIYQPYRLTLKIPLGVVWGGTRFLGGIFPGKATWIYSCYDKLANSLVFDIGKMLDTGFQPLHTLKTIFKE